MCHHHNHNCCCNHHRAHQECSGHPWKPSHGHNDCCCIIKRHENCKQDIKRSNEVLQGMHDKLETFFRDEMLNLEKNKELKSTGISVDGSATYTLPHLFPWTSPVTLPKINVNKSLKDSKNMSTQQQQQQQLKSLDMTPEEKAALIKTMEGESLERLERTLKIAERKHIELVEYMASIMYIINKKKESG